MSELKKIKRKGAKKKKNKADSKRSFRLGLKGKLLLYFLLMSLIPAIGLTIYSTTQMMSSYTTDRLDQLWATAEAKGGLIETWFDARRGEVNVISAAPAIFDGARVLQGVNETAEDVLFAEEEIGDSFEEAIYFFGAYNEMYLLSENGTVLITQSRDGYTDGHDVGADQSTSEYFTACFANKDFENSDGVKSYTFLSDFRWSSSGNSFQITVSSPVYDELDNWRFLGVVVAYIDEEITSDMMMDTQGLGESGETYLISHENLWLSESKFQSEGDWYMVGGGSGDNFDHIDGSILNSDITVLTDGIVECLSTQADLNKESNLDYRGIAVMGSYHFLEINDEGQPWVMVAEIDVSEALATPTQLQQVSIWIMVAVAGIIAVMAFIIARQIANPVKELSDLSETIAGGNYEVDVDIKAQDEVEDLVNNFRTMKENVLNALKYSENLISGLPVSVLAVDNDFNIEKLNPTLESLLGLKSEDLIGKKCYDVFRYDICNTENCQVRKAWRLNGITDSDDIKTLNRDNQEEMELRMSASPLIDGNGNTTGGIEVSLDVTLENQMTREVELAAEQISASVEELSSSAEEVSASSENIASTQQQLSKGSAEQVMAITETQRKFGDLSKGIRTIREKVENIGQVADLIKGIASQTNMLALNAAIEAARAGEAGRGFNVVADQVRKLADESRNAVANTEEMLAEIDVISKQQEGGALEILKAIDAIATIAEESSSSTEEAASAAEEQASSMEQITSSAQTMADIVQRLESLLEASKKGKGGGSKKISLEQKSLKPENMEEAEIDKVSSDDSAF